jgi:hypothetical protein
VLSGSELVKVFNVDGSESEIERATESVLKKLEKIVDSSFSLNDSLVDCQ